ncbi:MAG: carbon-nitrogen hydrolase family protein [Phycisphaerae bacterium]|nr:carbon-nitrogen hydrolase family protein [Phycisphaerae bacterium]
MAWCKGECGRMAVAVMILGLGLAAHGAETQPAKDDQKGEPSHSRRVGVSCICHPAGRSIAEMDKLIDAAALDRPDLILLTEGCMQNSAPSASRTEKDAQSEPLPEPGPITQFLARKAKQHRAYIMGSYWRKGPKGQGRYNSAVLVDRQGKVAGCYDKAFPTIGEMEDGVLPGRGAVVFDTDFGRIGALICFDLNFPELLAEYKQRGTKLLCFLSAFRGGRLIPAAAMRNQCFIASAVPNENGVIVDPLGRTLAESSQYGRIIFTRVNLDSQIVHIDYNADRVRRMKEKYGPLASADTASPEAVFLLFSLHPERSIQDMIREFEIETLDSYLDRAREVRRKHLGATTGNHSE